MVRDNRHVSTYIFGAICPDRAVGAAMIMPYANTWAMNAHLVEISAEVAPGAHAVLVCDGAGWHQRGTKLTVPDNITLLTLPPYSPELIPVRLKADTRPLAGADGADSVWVVDEEAPGALAGVEDVVVGVPDRGAELVLAQVGPDVLHGIQFG